MSERTKCPCCGVALEIEGRHGHVDHYICGSYSVDGHPPVRSRNCLDRELATLRRFVRDVRENPGDVLSLLERLAEVTR